MENCPNPECGFTNKPQTLQCGKCGLDLTSAQRKEVEESASKKVLMGMAAGAVAFSESKLVTDSLASLWGWGKQATIAVGERTGFQVESLGNVSASNALEKLQSVGAAGLASGTQAAVAT